jgi:hypothetical protein
MRVLVILCLLAGTARADLVWGVQLAGGMEGGLITRALRPDAVAEAGTIVEALDPKSGAGIAVSLDAIGRLTPPFDDAEEIKSDVMFRWASEDRRWRMGFGAGVRAITPKGGATIHGYDLFRMDLSGRVARWRQTTADLYFSWTFGCYKDTYAARDSADDEPAMRSVGCLETITTAYVFGLRTSLEFR